MVQVALTPFVTRAVSRQSLELERNFDRKNVVQGLAAGSDFGFLRAGSFWINGVPCSAFPPYDVRNFTIDVSEATTGLYAAYQKIGQRHLIPPFARYVPFVHTYFLALKTTSPSLTVLIPCSEISVSIILGYRAS